MIEIDRAEGACAVLCAMRNIPPYSDWKEDLLTAAISAAINADIGYMRDSGVFDGGEYDEYAAHKAIALAVAPTLPDPKSAPSFADDFMEAWEIYLDSTGLIEWE